LLPAINFVLKNKKYQVFISTYTKVLQEQLMEKDIPELKQIYPGVNFEHLKANSEGLSI
jgi:Rad3-related DNA helicase